MLQLFGFLKAVKIPLVCGGLRVVLVVTSFMILSGCDPVRTTSQSITMLVKDDQGMPVPDVRVSIKESWESWISWDSDNCDKKSQEPFYRERWESDFVPWHESRTDAKGSAVLTIVVTSLDGSRGTQAPPKRDTVSNREYIVRLESHGAEDRLLVEMTPGAVISGKRYIVRVEGVGQPMYVKD